MLHDTIVIGGGFAGLSAATYLARARRTVCVLDTRQPRNRFADASHGFLGQDGIDPRAILAAGRKQLDTYPTARLVKSEAIAAETVGDGFAITLASGETMEARKLILAFGYRDDLPAVPGLQERWGKTVLHCPYCHGIEFADRQLGVLYRSKLSVHQAMIVGDWGPVTLFLNGEALDADSEASLAARHIAIEPGRLSALEGEKTALSAIALKDGRRVPLDALYVAPGSCLSSPLAGQLGAVIDDGPLGPIIRSDGDRMTTVPGLYAAGDIARAPHSIAWAVADGATAGTAAHRALVFG